ncbi:benzoate/H(+) symporter BenE family transporter [Halalkalibacter alkalisediminis]|uniref:Benzoate/H(+) symporter BenE family transporter n=1 Tax=Halalkalibacter alkalisediminis TaxID=935616 RepID=A0ABV6NK71_9BACI|nr:benzoate/H(+) symporter BenE family transporter [Halalkalibacter alkalisediminis]
MLRFIKLIVRKTTISIISSGILATIMTCVTPTLVALEVAQRHNLPEKIVISWIFGAYVLAGCMGFLIAWQTKHPINATMSVPAIVFIGSALYVIPIHTAIFGYAVSGVMIALIGIFKLYDKMIKFIKPQIVMAMFAGAMIHYTVNIVVLTSNHILYGGIAIIAYLLTMRKTKLIPPVLMSMIIVTIVLGLNGLIPFQPFTESAWVSPAISFWEPSWKVIFSISIPLMLIVLSAEITIGASILRSEHYHPNVNKMTLYTGIATILGSFFGSHSVTTSGVPVGALSDPMTGPKKRRFLAAIWASFFTFLFGIFASYVYAFLSMYPIEILQILVGLVLVSILIKALRNAFGNGRFQYGAFTSLIVAMSNITIFDIGAPFWAVIFGMGVSYFVEGEDFRVE